MEPHASQSAHIRILSFLTEWCSNHPNPDDPALSVAQLGEYSPRQICEAVDKRTEAGRFIESLIQFGAARHDGNLDGVLESFLQENQVSPGRAAPLSIETK
jgi:hypothetical protein